TMLDLISVPAVRRAQEHERRTVADSGPQHAANATYF
ncbi:MAG: hypothetical protein JWM19_1637, partial [Actinomycetia bacterium]|nr:hypothetical protein [Actinomycetes bacterium]